MISYAVLLKLQSYIAVTHYALCLLADQLIDAIRHPPYPFVALRERVERQQLIAHLALTDQQLADIRELRAGLRDDDRLRSDSRRGRNAHHSHRE